jgi:hypothetical protein
MSVSTQARYRRNLPLACECTTIIAEFLPSCPGVKLLFADWAHVGCQVALKAGDVVGMESQLQANDVRPTHRVVFQSCCIRIRQ